MKKYVIVFLIFTIATKISAQDLIIKNINLITMKDESVLKNQSVLIRNGQIREIGEYKKLTRNTQTTIINGKGKYLMPGLADMHVHLPEVDEVEKLLLANIAAGVTQIRVMNSVTPQLSLRETLNQKLDLISPNIHYSHLIKSSDRFNEMQADSLMLQLKNDRIGFIKIISLSNEETFNNLTKSANKHHITIGGHFPVYRKDGKSISIPIEKVIASNYKSIEHLAGYISLQDEQLLENAIKLTKANDIYNCPTLDWDITTYNLQYPNEYKNRITYQILPSKFAQKWEIEIAANVAKAGGAEKVIASKDKYKATYDLKIKVLKKLYENGCLLIVGSDPGNVLQENGFNVYEEMINWSKAGIDNYTILKSATVNPSKFFNESDQWGTIEIGKNAEMIILEKNPLVNIKNISTLETTIVGQKVYQNKTLINRL